MADQLTPLLMGCYGHPVVQTPNLDRLAEHGVRFDAAYSPCPLCAPARASLMTGTYISQNKVWDNAAPLASDQPTFAHYLTLAGYDTVTSGKMHYAGPDQLHGLNRRLTTDIYPASFSWVPTPHRARENRFIDRRQHANGYRLPRVGVAPWSQFLAYDTETQFRALEYLRARALGSEERPFFLCVSYHCPHDPFLVPQDLWDLYEGAEIEIPRYPDNLEQTYSAMDRWLNAYHGTDRIDIRQPESLVALRRSYYALVTWIDRLVGELLEEVDRLGMGNHTAIVFTADHGDMLADKNMVQKRSFYEMSSRVPMVMRLPGGAGAGTTSTQPVNLIDLAPTFLQMAGVENWVPVDGRSLLPCVEGTETDRVTFSESHTNGVYEPCFMVRRGKFKYVYIRNERGQLFDLEEDPGEWRNLCGDPAYAQLEADLRALILSRFDPDAIEEELCLSLERRTLLKAANQANDLHWDYSPFYDATQQYCR
jgi:choline-sulfatase